MPQVCSAGPVSPQGEYSAFVYSYAVEKPLSVGHKVAGYLPSLFWGFITLGRLISIPISSKVKPATMVFVNVVSGLLSLLGDAGGPSTPGPTTAPGHLLGTGQGGNAGVEGGEQWGERCREEGGNQEGGAYLCDLGKIPFPLWASDFVPIRERGRRRWLLPCVEQISADSLPRVQVKRVLALVLLCDLDAQLVRAPWPAEARHPLAFRNHRVWAGA